MGGINANYFTTKVKKKIGLLFGSFNPIHVGHLIVANYVAEYTDSNEVWLVVTPHNPLKKKQELLADYHRLELVRLATEQYLRLKPCDVEFFLPQPNYTVDTLTHLEERFPMCEFALILGEDSFKTLYTWKRYEFILEHFPLYIYPRIHLHETLPVYPHNARLVFLDAPRIEISSTYIREGMRQGKNVCPLLPPEAWRYINAMNFYEG